MRQFPRFARNRTNDFARYYATTANKCLKYVALGVIFIAIILMLVMIFFLDSLSRETLLFMRGCAGLCGIIFFIFCTILIYRVNSAYWQHRNKSEHRQNNK